MEDIIVPIAIVGMLFIGMPWLILHYTTKWRQSPKITDEDEQLLDELHLLARRLEDRLQTVERIVAADNPDFRPDFRTDFRPSRPPQDDGYDFDRQNLQGRN
ncbi:MULTISPECIES: envelope stress response membrane protein PspB [Sphingobium]|uniref:envelope stress response membrane protein PspB n=1 Tax=Sphingobium sp. MI1205 TaxID=407020 RepID=UPI0007705BC1|nr:envelope stress response membrane protein PspB [Sphingobium sp. MI1205]AMK19504.1 phage shock protein B [Sphingobium sp. MI1205]